MFVQFLLTCPSRGATGTLDTISFHTDISTHMPLAGRDAIEYAESVVSRISTHMPLAGRDDEERFYDEFSTNFYSHAPRGARLRLLHIPSFAAHFYSHAPRGARPLHLAHAASAPVTYWGGPGFSLVYRAHGGPFRAKNRIFSGEPPGISQL